MSRQASPQSTITKTMSRPTDPRHVVIMDPELALLYIRAHAPEELPQDHCVDLDCVCHRNYLFITSLGSRLCGECKRWVERGYRL